MTIALIVILCVVIFIIALLVPSALERSDPIRAASVTRALSLGLSILLIVAYALGMLFSLKTHRELFASGDAEHEQGEEAPWPVGVAVANRLEDLVVLADGAVEALHAVERQEPDAERQHVVLPEGRLEERIVGAAVDVPVDPLVEVDQPPLVQRVRRPRELVEERLGLRTVGIVATVLCRRVVTFPALRAGERDDDAVFLLGQIGRSYSITFVMAPAPTVRPPSRMAKRTPSSMATG